MSETTKTAAREFWIEVWREKPIGPLIENRPVATRPFEACTDKDELIHTIEYTAYQQLEAKVRELTQKNEELSQLNSAKDAKILELEAKLNKASFFAQASTSDSTK